MTKRLATFLAALVAAGGLAATVTAMPGRHSHGLEKRIASLDLADETETAAFAILDEARSASRALRGEVRDAHDALRALLDAEEVDEAAVMAQADVVGSLHTEIRKHELRTLLRVGELLTAEQRRALFERGRRHGRRD